jgi:predicted phosphodiesterase
VKIAVLTDVHANLPALEAALEAIRRESCDALYHLGDAIGIGPFPAECLDLLLTVPDLHFVLGNHDEWFVHGLPRPQPDWMSDGEVTHQHWTHSQLDSVLRIVAAQWPYVIAQVVEGVRLTFTHYGLQKGGLQKGLQKGRPAFAPIIGDPTPADLEEMFAPHESDILFYGHHHPASDIAGEHCRYVNPGSLGCQPEAVAPFVVLVCENGRYQLSKHMTLYEDAPLFQAFEQRRVPERAFFYRAFFGGRFKPMTAMNATNEGRNERE